MIAQMQASQQAADARHAEQLRSIRDEGARREAELKRRLDDTDKALTAAAQKVQDLERGASFDTMSTPPKPDRYKRLIS